MSDYQKHVERAAARAEREILRRVAKFRVLTTKRVREMLDQNPTPWERKALHRVLRERGEE